MTLSLSGEERRSRRGLGKGPIYSRSDLEDFEEFGRSRDLDFLRSLEAFPNLGYRVEHDSQEKSLSLNV
jgi:hypothetical protein